MSTKNIADMDTDDFEVLTTSIKAMAPAHTHWVTQQGITTKVASETGTWSTPAAMWSIEINWVSKRYVVRQGADNKWTRFDDDLTWLKQILGHYKAAK